MSKKAVKSEREKAFNKVSARFRDKEEYENLLCRKKFDEYYLWCKENNGVENNEFGRRIGYIRSIKKLNTTQLANKCSIHRATVNDIEKGNNKSLSKKSTYYAIIKGLEVDIYDFINLRDDFETWKKVIFQKYALDDNDGFIDMKSSYDIDDILQTVFRMLDADDIFTVIDNKKIQLKEKHIEALRKGIYNSFDVVKSLLIDIS